MINKAKDDSFPELKYELGFLPHAGSFIATIIAANFNALCIYFPGLRLPTLQVQFKILSLSHRSEHLESKSSFRVTVKLITIPDLKYKMLLISES